jgi:hypothetical protein
MLNGNSHMQIGHHQWAWLYGSPMPLRIGVDADKTVVKSSSDDDMFGLLFGMADAIARGVDAINDRSYRATSTRLCPTKKRSAVQAAGDEILRA